MATQEEINNEKFLHFLESIAKSLNDTAKELKEIKAILRRNQ